MSRELKLFSKEARQRVYNRVVKDHMEQLTPIVLFFHRETTWKAFKQHLVVAINPEYTIHQLVQMLQVKLVWKGYLTEENKSLYVSVGDIQVMASLDKKVKALYDQHRKDDGWLELNVTTLNTFG